MTSVSASARQRASVPVAKVNSAYQRAVKLGERVPEIGMQREMQIARGYSEIAKQG